MNRFQRKHYQKTVNEKSEKSRNSNRVPSLSDCKSICFFCEYSTEPNMLQEFEYFKQLKRDFQVILFVVGKPYKGLVFNKLNVIPFWQNSFDFIGKINKEVLSRIQLEKYDICINTIPEMNLETAVVFKKIRADFKIGRDSCYENLNDLTILLEKTKSTENYLKEILLYTEKLNK